MKKIAPSILSADLFNLGHDLKSFLEFGCQEIHIDVMDHHFVPNLGFSPQVVRALARQTDCVLDVHLMCENPEAMIPLFAEAGADIITIHVESTPHTHRAIQMIKNQGVKAGVALNPGTPISQVQELLRYVDRVLVMTVNPGFGGQAFIPEMIDKIKTLALLRENTGAHFDIEVDGGINEVTGEICALAGAEVFVAGSYLFNAQDRKEAYTKLDEAIHKK